MGKVNNVLNRYFQNKERFADLFNGIYFDGNAVIQPGQLEEVSTSYYELDSSEHPANSTRSAKLKQKRARKEYKRDIKMRLNTGESLQLLALENQDSIDYTMPFRCLQYDTFEYHRQLEKLQAENLMHNDFETPGERLCRFKKTDRLQPIYTICMYHGEEPWDGPRSLKDMMDFGKDEMLLSQHFKDYPLSLYCLNEETDFNAFHGDVRTLFTLLQYRKDKKGLLRRLGENSGEFEHLNEETLEVASVMMDVPRIWENREQYLNYDEENKEGYDMCQAIREIMEDKLAEGIERGIERGIEQGIEQGLGFVIRNMLLEGVDDANIRKFTLCEQALIDRVRAELIP